LATARSVSAGRSPCRGSPASDGLFARIEHRVSGGDDVWELHDRAGLRSQYGTPRERWGGAPADPAVLAHPGGQVFEWRIARTEDPFGNLIQYTWTGHADAADGQPEGPVPQLYPDAVRWLDHGERDAPRWPWPRPVGPQCWT
jgi:hypothetical protein